MPLRLPPVLSLGPMHAATPPASPRFALPTPLAAHRASVKTCTGGQGRNPGTPRVGQGVPVDARRSACHHRGVRDLRARRTLRLACLLSLLAGPACGGDDSPAEDGGGDDGGGIGDDGGRDAAPPDAGTAPAAPDHNDPRYEIEGLRAWYLVGNDLTAGDDALELSVSAPAGTSTVALWLDGVEAGAFAPVGGVFAVSADLGSLEPGRHAALLAADGAATAFARLVFTRSHPLYVFVSNDWDDPDVADEVLDRQEALRTLHPSLRMTHFVGPYTFTEPDMPAGRADALVAWLSEQRDDFGDEVGLHIHPYCSFVTAAGISCLTQPTAAGYPDATGYAVFLATYSEEETFELLRTADELFTAHDLDKPTSFRAGAWAAGIHTLRALDAAGHVADASAVAWQRLEEWEGLPLYDWNREHWEPIGDTSQPYHPSEDDALSSAPPQLALLEVPDNAALADYVTGREMEDVLEANWPGDALPEPRVFSIGYHPSTFYGANYTRMDVALANVDLFLAADDAGPLVYATASELALVWPLSP